MADRKELIGRYAEARDLILDSRLHEAVGIMQAMTMGIDDWSAESRLQELADSYGTMLRYFAEGVRDERRQTLYDDLRRQALLLTDDILRARLLPDSMDLYYQYIRLHRNARTTGRIQQSLEVYCNASDRNDANLAAQHERDIHELFGTVWTSGLWTSEEQSQAMELICSDNVTDNDRPVIVSAVTIALLHRFDPLKMQFLCTVAAMTDIMLSVRALVGLALAVRFHEAILPLFPAVTDQISLLTDIPGLKDRMLVCQMALLLCRETNKIDRRMREEIIPGMLKSQKLGEILTDELTGDDISPEWSGWIEKSGIRDSLIEMTELQMEGADVYMSTFSNLKSYPMFREPSNWLRPFDVNQPDVRGSMDGAENADSAFVRLIMASDTFCNSDKFSFLLTFSQIPKQQRDMIAGQVGGEMEQLKQQSDSEQPSIRQQERVFARQYCQDLYRFFKLFYRRHEFHDPFLDDLNLTSDRVMSQFLDEDSSQKEIALWLLKRKYYAESAVLLTRMEADGSRYSADSVFYQQLGYALQMSGHWKQALEAYFKSDLLQPDNVWTLRHMAQCHRVLHSPDKALELLLEAEKSAPDNISLQIQIGDCLLEMQNYDEALARFFKVDYLKPEYPKAWRAIAWCAFLAGQYEKASAYYDRLAAVSDNGTDFLNAGHNCWVQGQTEKAVDWYRKGQQHMERSDFMEEFQKDIPILVSKGIDVGDIPLMTDCIGQF
ncbi:MAG: tetratricopeptide repeat protein [Bacteroidaceae bacterium]|nr:tetratricopeptide repeat protein [Bacteroidaceae bacterium]